jgi:Domain of unknown function (DUF4062)
MTTDRAEPASFRGVMVSSTFNDLEAHRRVMIRALDGADFKAVVMEHDSARLVDVLTSSLEMVRKAAGYVGVISHKYGQIADDPDRNPDGLSLTELEYNEAVRLDRPVLLFVMGPKHQVLPEDVETDPEKRRKLEAFRERATVMSGSRVARVYKVFNDLNEFTASVPQAISELRRHLDEHEGPVIEISLDRDRDFVPQAPELYAEPPYIGSHQFIGRQAQLETLNDWASAADPHPILLFEAIGGAGKSMLTWQWTTRHAMTVRSDWAGRFWYSFYEKGAVMADFCRRALAYMTGRPLDHFHKKRMFELSELLLRELRKRPWLLVLDGFERVLVAYHRLDAAQIADEEAGRSDEIAQRDPCSSINPDDDELLRALASATPSKLLLTSRLIPRVLLNPSSQPIPGVLHERLPGLRPADAELLFRSCGVRGDSQDIQSYLQTHCDCHPLVTGVLAGLINNYLPARGDFDAWADAADGGAALNLAKLDLVQKRNHILRAALQALPEKSRQLLSTLALLSEAADYDTLAALNPDLPREPEKVEETKKPEDGWRWNRMSPEEKAQAQRQYEVAVQRRQAYERAYAEWQASPQLLAAPARLATIVQDLERRGFLQYDAKGRQYDLHPVVRGIAAGDLRQEERLTFGELVVDHFSRQHHSPYDEAETVDDLRVGVQVVRTLLQMGRYDDAARAYRDDLQNALEFNVDAYDTILSLLRPFFPNGWNILPKNISRDDACSLAWLAGNALAELGDPLAARLAYEAALDDLLQSDHGALRGLLSNIGSSLDLVNRIAAIERCCLLTLDLASALGQQQDLFMARLRHFEQMRRTGRWQEAEKLWRLLDPMGRDWTRSNYRPGWAERAYAYLQFQKGDLSDEHLLLAENLAKRGRDRGILRDVHELRGGWYLSRQEWELAAVSLQDAIRMAREVGQRAAAAEAQLALAKFHLGRLSDPRHDAAQLARKDRSEIDLAHLWFAIGDHAEAKKHGLAAYKWAWADGEPYVRRYELNQARALLEQLGAAIPHLPTYDPSIDPTFPWEQKVADVIAQLKKKKDEAER